MAACGPNMSRFATETELFGAGFPGEPEQREIALDPVYNEPVEAVYWDNQREGGLGTILFVHGIPNNKRTFLYLYHALSEDFRCVAPDLPGFGWSSKPRLSALPPEEIYSCNTLGEFVVDFVIRLEQEDQRRRATALGATPESAFDHITIVANSYGCAAVMSALINTPQFGNRVDRIVYISPAVYYQRVLETSRLRRWMTGLTFLDPIIRGLRVDDRIAVNSYIRIFEDDFVPGDPSRYRIPREQIEETFGILNEPNFYYVVRQFARNIRPRNYEVLEAGYSEIPQSTLIVTGEDDQIVPNVYPRRLVNHMPSAQLVIFPHCGHQPHLELPEQTNALISGWIRGEIAGVPSLPAERVIRIPHPDDPLAPARSAEPEPLAQSSATD